MVIEEKTNREMLGVEYAFIARELDELLKGRHLQKFQKVDERKYRMRFEKYDVICEIGKRMHITNYLEEVEEADNFAQKVKKEIVGKRLRAVRQLNNDRIISFQFDDRELIFEMFREGNVILLENGKIIAALNEEKWANREIRVGKNYSAPPAPPQGITEALNEKPIVVSLIKLSLGKLYAADILKRCGIDEKKAGKDLTADEIERIKKEINFKPQPLVFLRDGKVIDYAIKPIIAYEEQGAVAEPTATLSEAADRYYWENKPVEEPKELKKLMDRIKKQEAYLEELKKEEQTHKEIGDWIYANYNYVENILRDAKEIGTKNLEKLKEKYNNIININKEKKIIEIEV